MLKLCVLLILVPFCYGQSCSTRGWYSKTSTSSCSFKCHCTDGRCDEYGTCYSPATCVKGWFTRYCQYADLTTTMTTSTTPSWLTDGDDTTCNPYQSSSSVAVTFTQPLPFTWLRLHVHNQDLLRNFTMTFLTSGGSTLDCKDMKNATLDQSTIDFHCNIKTEVIQVIISGAGVKALCSAYISGGRNVALKQNTMQTSDLNSYYNSSNAVDGNTSGDLNHRSCAVTKSSPSTSRWTLTFSHPVTVNRYVLYNRDSGNGLKQFTLRSYDKDGKEEFEYQHSSLTYQQVYTITNAATTKPISRVTITGEPTQLALCEAEMYGEYLCSAKEYGPECKYSDNNSKCKDFAEGIFVSTGGCPSGCPAGKTGRLCTLSCQPTYYGENCQEKCSINCRYQLCDRVSGKCSHSCVPGKSGDLCDKDCPDGYFGYDCKYQCSPLCNDTLCDPGTGACKTCPERRTGVFCEECPQGRYGHECETKCSEFCGNDGSCESMSGQCTHGCKDGYQGLLCNDPCAVGTFGKDCTSECGESCIVNVTGPGESPCHHVTGFCLLGCKPDFDGQECKESDSILPTAVGGGVGGSILLIAIIIIGVSCHKKRRSQQRAPKTQPPKEVRETGATTKSTTTSNVVGYSVVQSTDRDSAVYEDIGDNIYEDATSMATNGTQKKTQKPKNAAETDEEGIELYVNQP